MLGGAQRCGSESENKKGPEGPFLMSEKASVAFATGNAQQSQQTLEHVKKVQI